MKAESVETLTVVTVAVNYDIKLWVIMYIIVKLLHASLLEIVPTCQVKCADRKLAKVPQYKTTSEFMQAVMKNMCSCSLLNVVVVCLHLLFSLARKVQCLTLKRYKLSSTITGCSHYHVSNSESSPVSWFSPVQSSKTLPLKNMLHMILGYVACWFQWFGSYPDSLNVNIMYVRMHYGIVARTTKFAFCCIIGKPQQ